MQFNHGLRNITEALGELDPHLPDDFPPPTIWKLDTFSAYAEWGSRRDTSDPMQDAVWIIGSPEGVVMNANFREGWPEGGGSEFDAVVASEWLRDLTRDWEWSFERDGSTSRGRLRRSDRGLRKSA